MGDRNSLPQRSFETQRGQSPGLRRFESCASFERLPIIKAKSRLRICQSWRIKQPIMKKIVVFGASGHSRVICEIIKKSDAWRIIGIIDNASVASRIKNAGYRFLGTDDDLLQIADDFGVSHGIIAVGDNYRRDMIHRKILSLCPWFKFGTAVHPSACLAEDVTVGEGSVLMAGSVINSGARIGRFCILNTNSSLDHDSEMEDFASLAPGVVTGGNVSIGTCSALGIGAIVKHGVLIGEHAVVGAGAIVMRDVSSFSVSYGQPCKFVRARVAGECYL